MANDLALGIVIGATVSGTVGNAFRTLEARTQSLRKTLKQVSIGKQAAASVIQYRDKLEQLRNMQQQFGLSNTRLWGRIAETEKALRKAEQAAEKYGLNIGDIVRENDRLIQSEQRVQRQLDRTRQRLNNRNKRQAIKSQAAETIGLAFAAAEPLRQAIQFESVMADVKKVTNLSNAEFQQMGKSILKLSDQMPIAASGIGEIIAAAGQSGIAKDQLLDFAKSAAQMGVAFDISAAEAGKMMADWRAGMQLNQTQTVELANATNYLSNNMNASAAAIGEVIQRQGAVAKAAGLSAVQTAALSAALLSSGAAPEIAATALKNLTGALTKGTAATGNQKKAFAALGLDAVTMANRMQTDAKGAITDVFKALQAAPKSQQGSLVSLLFGEESKGAIMPLLVNMDNLNKAFKMTASSTQFAGSMLDEYKTRSKTTENSLQLLKNRVTHLGVSIGSVLLPPLNTVVGLFGGVITSVTGLAEQFPALTAVVVGAAVGLVGLKLVSMGVSFGMTLVSDAIIFARAVMDFFSLSTLRANAALVVQKAAVIGLAIKQKAMAAWTGMSTAAQWAWNAALTANPIGLVIAGVVAFGALAYTVYKKWEPIKQFFKDLWGTVGQVVSSITSFFGSEQDSPPKGSRKSRRQAQAAAVISGAMAASPAAVANTQTQINNTMHITQMAGEDSEALARRIVEIQRETQLREEADVR